MRRICVVGNSASGKTTLARAAAATLDLPYLELDSIYHGPEWTPRPEFRQEVEAFVSGDRWVVDGNYTRAGTMETVWPRADALVWLDPPRRLVMWRVVRRTAKRLLTREELWNGNRERIRNLIATDPEENIVLWTWTRHDEVRREYQVALSEGTWRDLAVHRLRDRRDVREFLTSLH
jgi:adenylate kinase family enzyme